MRWPGARAAPANATRDDHARTRLRPAVNARRSGDPRRRGDGPRRYFAHAQPRCADCSDRPERLRQDHPAARRHGTYPRHARPRHLGRPRRVAAGPPRHIIPAPGHAPAQHRRQCPLRPRCRRRAAHRAIRPRRRIARAGRTRRLRPAPGAPSLRRRTAAAGIGARAGARSRSAVPRRADCQPRSRRHQGDRGHRARHQRARRQGRDGDARSRRSETACRRDRAAASRALDRARPGVRIFRKSAHTGGAEIHRRRIAGLNKNTRGRIHMLNRRTLVAAALGAVIFTAPAAFAQDKSIVGASTTSTQDSGLFEYLLPLYKQKTGVTVKVVSQGTGQALDTGRRGDADVVFVHAKSAEEEFLAEGEGVKRFPVMYNDFVLIGPKSDPAGIKGMKDVGQALKRIMAKQAAFTSRGDRSGTHVAELKLWKASGIDIEKDLSSKNFGAWYKSIGQGMGAALNTAGAGNAYVLSDRGTWIHYKNKGDLAILVEGDKRMFNQYGVMLVNPAKHPNVKKELGQQFIDYLTSPEGQKDIANYKIN